MFLLIVAYWTICGAESFSRRNSGGRLVLIELKTQRICLFFKSLWQQAVLVRQYFIIRWLKVFSSAVGGWTRAESPAWVVFAHLWHIAAAVTVRDTRRRRRHQAYAQFNHKSPSHHTFFMRKISYCHLESHFKGVHQFYSLWVQNFFLDFYWDAVE